MKFKLRILYISIFCFLGTFLPESTAQDFTKDYQPLEIQAPIPTSILTKSYRKSQTQIENRDSGDERRKTREAKEGYIIETNYILDRLLESSELLFNTELNIAIERIAEKLLKDKPELFKTFTFYVIKSSAVNAFATDRGDVFVTMGLLARLKTEAELAFVLAHEIIHTQEKHSMQSFDKQWEIKADKRFRNQGSVTLLTEKSNFSKEKEIEADSKGLKLYTRTNYSFADVKSVFDILEYGHAPVFRDSVSRSIFELPNLKIRDDLWFKDEANKTWLAGSKPITSYEDRDAYSTHPDIDVRVENVEELIVEDNNTARNSFDIFSQIEFSRLVKLAQLELSLIYLMEKEYSKGLYHTAILLEEFPENQYLQKNFVYAIYAYAQHEQRQDEMIEDLLNEDSEMQGGPSKLRFFLRKMSQKELTVFATAHTYLLAQKYPEDDQVQRMARDMAEDLVIYTIKDPNDYFVKIKTDSLRDYFTRTAFSDYLEEKKFKEHLESGKKYRAKREKRLDYEETKEGRAEKDKEEREIRINGEKLGLDKIVFVNPFYFKGKLNITGEIVQDYEKSEIAQTELLTQLEESSQNVGLETEILDINAISKNTDIQTVKDIHLIERYGNELYSNPGYIVSLHHNKTQSIIDRYDTTNFAYLGVAALNNKARAFVERMKINKGWLIPIVLFTFAETAPFFIYKSVKKRNELFYYTAVFDIQGYDRKMEEFNMLEMKDNAEVINTQLHWSLQQMKNQKKSNGTRKK